MQIGTLTPRNSFFSNSEVGISGLLEVNNWVTGVHATGPAGYYYQITTNPWTHGPWGGTGTIAHRAFMIPYVEETLETLHERDRLLLKMDKDYTNNTNLPGFNSWSNESLVLVMVTLDYPLDLESKKIMVTFDIEAPRPTEVQLFVMYQYQQTLPLSGRGKKAILAEIAGESSTYYFVLRPVKIGLYFYSLEVNLF